MRERGIFDDPLIWLESRCGEDVATAVCAHACGFQLLDFNGEGEPFGVDYEGLPAPPERLIERGHAIIHSLKRNPGWSEDDIRTLFRTRRETGTVSRTV
jgi:hypothetical protein